MGEPMDLTKEDTEKLFDKLSSLPQEAWLKRFEEDDRGYFEDYCVDSPDAFETEFSSGIKAILYLEKNGSWWEFAYRPVLTIIDEENPSKHVHTIYGETPSFLGNEFRGEVGELYTQISSYEGMRRVPADPNENLGYLRGRLAGLTGGDVSIDTLVSFLKKVDPCDWEEKYFESTEEYTLEDGREVSWGDVRPSYSAHIDLFEFNVTEREIDAVYWRKNRNGGFVVAVFRAEEGKSSYTQKIAELHSYIPKSIMDHQRKIAQEQLEASMKKLYEILHEE